MAIIKKFTKRGFTLIELMIVVVIIGILAALAIYGVQKYVASSKSAEARTMLGRMSKDMLTFFESENQRYEVLAPGDTADISRSLCPDAAALPSAVPSAQKAQIDAGSFDDDSGWECLGTVITTPVYYQYSVASDQAGTDLSALSAAAEGETFTAIAIGDLDGDGVFSRFNLGGEVFEGTNNSLQLNLATTVQEIDPEE